jgi:hypothetical protein
VNAARRPLAPTFWGAAAGALLYSAIDALPGPGGDRLFSFKFAGGWGFTAIFAIPMVLGLGLAGRIRWPGALVLIAAITGAHFAAIRAAIAVYGEWGPSSLCMFGCAPGDQARHDAEEARGLPLAGAAGGAAGAALSFVPLLFFGPAVRRGLPLLAGAVVLLAALDAFGLWAGLRASSPLVWAATLYLPWQGAFGAALALALSPHAPLRRLGVWQRPRG